MAPYGGDKKDPRVTGEMLHSYLHTYAETHDLLRRIKFNTFVIDATKTSTGWRLRFKDSKDTVETNKLMVATGVTSIPSMPDLRQTGDRIPLIHSRDLGESFLKLQNETVQTVTVVGAGKSANDAVYLLLKMGKKVNWLIREEGTGPLAIIPFKILGLVNSISFASTRLTSFLSPSILNCEGTLSWMFHRTSLGRWCVGRLWEFLDFVSQKHAGYSSSDHIQRLKPGIERQAIFWSHSGLGVVTSPDFWKTLHKGRISIIRDEVIEVKNKSVLLKSGQAVATDYIVMCTGWGDHFSMFSQHDKSKIGLPHSRSVTDESGIDWDIYDAMANDEVDKKLPFLAKPPALAFEVPLSSEYQCKWRLYRRVVPIGLDALTTRSLAILGQIHTVQTPLVAEIQSLWAILYLEGEIALPSPEEMAKEVSLWNAWTRKRYLGQGQKIPYSLYDFLPYIDVLFKDMKLQSRRKSNPLSDFFTPYSPADFAGFVDEYLARRPETSRSAAT
ncbi:dimethylaniline monooxygenase [Cordyceps javanica]|uniref:Dimethylaniline monooxygenase n=1 Tax=Cordyceps javanica TaxID=43265 RepID=A0A545V3Q9_9HYPO|nr:dimethylaniline monooxygenase [Cordyceps javanica]TQW07654.1 dimethylaniline monooxygenase [Cordyceps javanica]